MDWSGTVSVEKKQPFYVILYKPIHKIFFLHKLSYQPPRYNDIRLQVDNYATLADS